MADYKFPTEMVELPSKGYFYFEGHPLSSGKVEVKYMTAREEDILTSQNLIQQGTVIDKLLESLVVDKSIKLEKTLDEAYELLTNPIKALDFFNSKFALS